MKQVSLDYTAQFSCLAGACPDTCCKDWEIILDEADVARYRALPGPLGEQVRAAITVTPEGEAVWRLIDGHCALLRPDGLCPIQCACGEEALCRTCRTHPRFWEEYGATRELTLALSCPGAARLLLSHTSPLHLTETELDAPVTPNDLDPALYLALQRVCTAMIRLAQTRSLALPDRLGLILRLAERVQPLLDAAHYGPIPALCREFEALSPRQLALVRRRMRPRAPFFPCWMVLRNMEHLTTRFPWLLDRANHAEPPDSFDTRFPLQAENLLVYFLFRYVLKAVNDGQLLPRAESCIFHLLSLRYLCGAAGALTPDELQPVVSLYCKEVEHSEENLRLLQRIFSRNTISPRALYRMMLP